MSCGRLSMGARERFAQTRKYVIELNQILITIMYQGDDWKPDDVRAPGVSDPTANVAIRNVDEWPQKLTELRRRESELKDFIGTTLAVISAVRKGLGDDYADILDQRYIDCLEWRDVQIDGKTVKRSTGKMRVAVAFDWIDSIGISRLLRGDVEV